MTPTPKGDFFMPEVTRRRLLSSAAAGAGGVLASSLLPPALASAAAQGPRRGRINDVKHVVIHMQENRSFDHYFGTLGGVAGFGDPNALVQTDPNPPFNAVQGKSIFYQVDPGQRRQPPCPLPPPTRRIPAALAPRHAEHQLAGDPVDVPRLVLPAPVAEHHRADHGRTADHRAQQQLAPVALLADHSANYWYVMGYYERQDIPFHFALAETSHSATTITARCSARPGRTACTS